jgi:hypothetical protein
MRLCPSSSGSKELRPGGERRRGVRSGVGAREADRAAPVCGWVGIVAADRGELRPVDIARGGGDARPWSERSRLARGPWATASRGASAGRARASARWARSRQSSNAPTVVPTTRNLLGSRNERREGSQVLGGRADRALGGLGDGPIGRSRKHHYVPQGSWADVVSGRWGECGLPVGMQKSRYAGVWPLDLPRSSRERLDRLRSRTSKRASCSVRWHLYNWLIQRLPEKC